MKSLNIIQIDISSEQVMFEKTSKTIKVTGLDNFDIKQIQTFKNYNEDVLIIQTEYFELHIRKGLYAIRMYTNGTVRFTRRE